MVTQSEPTPTDRVSARAIDIARRQALSSLYGYTKISDRMLRAIVVSIGVSLTLNLAAWIYLLVRLPP